MLQGDSAGPSCMQVPAGVQWDAALPRADSRYRAGAESTVPPLSFIFSFFSFFLFSPLGLMVKKPRRFRLRKTQMPFAASSLDPISNIPALENNPVYEVDREL